MANNKDYLEFLSKCIMAVKVLKEAELMSCNKIIIFSQEAQLSRRSDV
jgi:hypothetical protein